MGGIDTIELVSIINATCLTLAGPNNPSNIGHGTFSWTAPNDTPTEFIGGVYDYERFSDPLPSPWCCVIDEPSQPTKEAMGGLLYTKHTPLCIYICSSFAQLSEREVETRQRYAFQAVEKLITLKSTMDTILAPGYRYISSNYGIMDSIKVKVRKLTLQIQSRI